MICNGQKYLTSTLSSQWEGHSITSRSRSEQRRHKVGTQRQSLYVVNGGLSGHDGYCLSYSGQSCFVACFGKALPAVFRAEANDSADETLVQDSSAYKRLTTSVLIQRRPTGPRQSPQISRQRISSVNLRAHSSEFL